MGRKKKITFVVGLILITAGLTAFLLLKNKGEEPIENDLTVGHVNLGYIFDRDAPIPVALNGKYGFRDASTGEWKIQPKYSYAERFYGDFAKVTFLNENYGKSAIINRENIVQIMQEDAAQGLPFEYNTEYNFWTLNGNIYTAELKKINPDNTRASHVGLQYFLAYSTQSYTISSDEEQFSREVTKTPIVFNGEGETIYECKNICSVVATQNDKNIDSLLITEGDKYSVYDVANTKVVYTTEDGNKISVNGNGVYSEMQDDEIVKSFLVTDGKTVSVDASTTSSEHTVSNDGNFVVRKCENDKYRIEKTSGETVRDCSVVSYVELPDNVYKYFDKKGQPLIFVEDADGVALYDLKSKKTVKNYGASDVKLYENSPFFESYDYDNNIHSVCDLSNANTPCLTVSEENFEVNAFGNYFTLSNTGYCEVYKFGMERIDEK